MKYQKYSPSGIDLDTIPQEQQYYEVQKRYIQSSSDSFCLQRNYC